MKRTTPLIDVQVYNSHKSAFCFSKSLGLGQLGPGTIRHLVNTDLQLTFKKRYFHMSIQLQVNYYVTYEVRDRNVRYPFVPGPICPGPNRRDPIVLPLRYLAQLKNVIQ